MWITEARLRKIIREELVLEGSLSYDPAWYEPLLSPGQLFNPGAAISSLKNSESVRNQTLEAFKKMQWIPVIGSVFSAETAGIYAISGQYGKAAEELAFGIADFLSGIFLGARFPGLRLLADFIASATADLCQQSFDSLIDWILGGSNAAPSEIERARRGTERALADRGLLDRIRDHAVQKIKEIARRMQPTASAAVTSSEDPYATSDASGWEEGADEHGTSDAGDASSTAPAAPSAAPPLPGQSPSAAPARNTGARPRAALPQSSIPATKRFVLNAVGSVPYIKDVNTDTVINVGLKPGTMAGGTPWMIKSVERDPEGDPTAVILQSAEDPSKLLRVVRG